MSKRPNSANYGFDAPGITKRFFLASLLLLVVAFSALPWHPSKFVVVCGWILMTFALIPLVLGLAMVAYFLIGKMRTRNLMLGLVPWTGFEQVLDIGTGAGLLAIGAAKKLRSGSVVGIDLWSERDLSNNRQSVTLHNLAVEGVSDKVSIQTGDARSLQFPEQHFDRVVSLLCLHNIEDKQEQRAACTEIARVLKPGGFAVIGDYLPTSGYAQAFKTAGLKIVQEKTAFTTALALMWILIAEKPVLEINS